MNVLGANKVFHDPFRGNLFLYEMHHLERDEALFELGEDWLKNILHKPKWLNLSRIICLFVKWMHTMKRDEASWYKMLSEKVLIFLIIELDVQRALDSSFDVLSNNLHLNRSQPQWFPLIKYKMWIPLSAQTSDKIRFKKPWSKSVLVFFNRS